MDPLLLFIWPVSAGALSLFALVIYRRLSEPRRIVSERISSGTSGLSYGPGSILRSRRSSIPFLRFLPISPEAVVRTTRDLQRAGWSLRAGEFLFVRLGSAAVAGVLGAFLLTLMGINGPILRSGGIALFVCAGWLAPRMYLSYQRDRRIHQVERQLPDALTAMVKTLQAGSGLLQALAYAAGEAKDPLGPELQATLRDLQLGADAEDSFGALSERVGSPDLDMVVTAVVIQRTVGGNLSEVLGNVTNTIRERVRLEGEIRTMTSQQRLSANFAALLPILVAGAVIGLRPELGLLLFTTTVGHIALAIGIAFEAVGIWLIRELATVDI